MNNSFVVSEMSEVCGILVGVSTQFHCHTQTRRMLWLPCSVELLVTESCLSAASATTVPSTVTTTSATSPEPSTAGEQSKCQQFKCWVQSTEAPLGLGAEVGSCWGCSRREGRSLLRGAHCAALRALLCEPNLLHWPGTDEDPTPNSGWGLWMVPVVLLRSTEIDLENSPRISLSLYKC